MEDPRAFEQLVGHLEIQRAQAIAFSLNRMDDTRGSLQLLVGPDFAFRDAFPLERPCWRMMKDLNLPHSFWGPDEMSLPHGGICLTERWDMPQPCQRFGYKIGRNNDRHSFLSWDRALSAEGEMSSDTSSGPEENQNPEEDQRQWVQSDNCDIWSLHDSSLPEPTAPLVIQELVRDIWRGPSSELTKGPLWLVRRRAIELLRELQQESSKVQSGGGQVLAYFCGVLFSIADAILCEKLSLWGKERTPDLALRVLRYFDSFVKLVRFEEECLSYFAMLVRSLEALAPRHATEGNDELLLDVLEQQKHRKVNRENSAKLAVLTTACDSLLYDIPLWEYPGHGTGWYFIWCLHLVEPPVSPLDGSALATVSAFMERRLDVPKRSNIPPQQAALHFLLTWDISTELATAERLLNRRSNIRDFLQLASGALQISVGWIPGAGEPAALTVKLILKLVGETMIDVTAKRVTALRLVDRAAEVFMAVWKLVSKADENRAPITKQYVDEFLDAVGIIIDAMHTTSGRRGFNNEVIHRNKIDMDIQQATDKLSLLVQKLNLQSVVLTSKWQEESMVDRKMDQQRFDTFATTVKEGLGTLVAVCRQISHLVSVANARLGRVEKQLEEVVVQNAEIKAQTAEMRGQLERSEREHKEQLEKSKREHKKQLKKSEREHNETKELLLKIHAGLANSTRLPSEIQEAPERDEDHEKTIQGEADGKGKGKARASDGE